MPTGEQPVVVDQRTSFAWPILVALLGVAGMGAVGLARAQDAGVAVKEHEKSIQELKVDSAENKSDHKAMRDLLERLDKKMDRIEQKLDAKR